MRLSHDLTVSPVGIFSQSSTQETDLGAKMVTSDGSVYRYTKAGDTTLVIGTLVDGPAMVTNHTNVAVAAISAIGASTITVTLGATAATVNQYQGGYIVINEGAGVGYSYRIKSHPAAALSASLVLTLEDDNLVQIATATTSNATLVPNQYSGAIIHPLAETGIPIGMVVYPITAKYYGWVKTRGVCAALQDASVPAIGQAVAASTTTAGCVTLGTGTNQLANIGYALAQGVDGEHNPIFLTIF